MNIKSSQTLVSEALKEIKTINTDEALTLFNDGKCNLIDIREKGELDKTGRVENSNHIPRGMLEFWLDPEGPYFKSGKLDMTKEMVLFCGGWIVKDSQKFGINKIIMSFPLIITYFIGPIGLTMYWIIRIFYAKRINLYD